MKVTLVYKCAGMNWATEKFSSYPDYHLWVIDNENLFESMQEMHLYFQ